MGVIIERVVDELYVLRYEDKETRYFEAIWAIPEGVTYNAYVLLTEEGVVLFDAWKHACADEFIESLRRIVDPRDIDYLVIHHMEPDHSGAIPRFLKENRGKAEVLGHRLTGALLKAFYGVDCRFKALRDGEELAVGSKVLKFVYTPWLHWPETIMSFIYKDKVLLSGDAFGGYSVPSSIFDDNEKEVLEYYRHVRKYVATIIGYYSDFIIKAIEKLKKLGISPAVIAPAHGLIFKNKPEVIVDYYSRLARGIPEKGKVVVIYGSMYGSIEKAVITAVEELRKRGMEPVLYKCTDSESLDVGEAISEIIDAEAIIIGAATYEGEVFPPMSFLLDILVKKIKIPKPVLVISSYGWGGVAGSKIVEKITRAGFDVVEKIEFRGKPKSEDLDKIVRGVDLLLERIGR